MCSFSFHWPPACSRGPVIVFLGWLPIKLLQSDLERLPPPSPSGCCGVDKSRTALARPAPLLRPLPPLPPPPPPREVSGGKRRARGRGGAGLRALSTRLAPPGHAATPTACAGPSGPGWEGQAPEGHLTLSLFSLRREEAGEEPTSPVTFIHAAPPGRKMFACAKLARTPALVRNPGVHAEGPALLHPCPDVLSSLPPDPGACRLFPAMCPPRPSCQAFWA